MTSHATTITYKLNMYSVFTSVQTDIENHLMAV